MDGTEVIAVMGEGFMEFTPAPIVRCRDCVRFRENLMYGDSYTWCGHWRRLVPPDGWCFKGVRRDGGHDGNQA